VFILADTSTVKVVFGVPDNVQRSLTLGQQVTVTTDAAADRTFSGAITKIAAQADAKTRIFDVEATLDNSEGILKVGMVSNIQIGRAVEATAILVPLSAIVRLPGDEQAFAVYVLAGSGVDTFARVRVVEIGNLVGNRVSVTKGVASGERVVVQGATLLRDNDRVNVVPGGVGKLPEPTLRTVGTDPGPAR
jgi:RND family efflux transporter MFP subunit